MIHPTRGMGTIVLINLSVEKFCTVEFNDGKQHSYSKSSMQKFKTAADSKPESAHCHYDGEGVYSFWVDCHREGRYVLVNQSL